MPKTRKPQVKPSKPAPRAAQIPSFLLRFTPTFQSPQWQDANRWRWAVRNQPIAISCRDTLISFLVGTEWQIRAKKPEDTEKYKTDIDYYTELFNNLNGLDFDSFLDLLCQDILDTPFGGAAEVGRLGDVPEGRVVWVQNIDSATLYPTYDFEFPVAQRVPGVLLPPVLFPRHAIDRSYLSPRPEYDRKGWGMAPPEKIYLAIDLLFRGDRYYANLLLDTPEAGILDLLDMDKESALEWLDSFQTLFTGADPFKVPVLYEHTQKAEWIPFGRPPTELIYDSVTFKYAQIVCAGYGLKISDIGMSQEEAKTLAGVIRAERQTRRTGFAALKAKTTGFFLRLLPKHLWFEWLDQDDETMLSQGRARLANFQAYGEAREKKILTLQEIRAQIAVDGLLDIQIDPDDPEALAMDDVDLGPDSVRPRTDDRDRVPPSEGGEGQLTFPRKSLAYLIPRTIGEIKTSASPPRIRRLFKAQAREIFPHVSKVLKILSADDVGDWAEGMTQAAFNPEPLKKKEQKALARRMKVLDKHLDADKWWAVGSPAGLDDSIALAYAAGTALAGNMVVKTLYEEGKIDEPNYVAKIDSSPGKISIVSLVESFDRQTRQLCKASIFASVCHAFATPTVYQSIQAGEKSVDDYLGNDNFMDMVVAELESAITEIFDSRATILSDEINGMVVEKAISDFFDKIGLKKGEWKLEEGSIRLNEAALLKLADRKDFEL